MRFFHDTKINFVGIRHQFFLVSLIVTILGLIAVGVLGVEYGIDFTGGTEIAVKFDKSMETSALRNAVSNTDLGVDEIKSYGKENQFLLRIKKTGKFSEQVKETLTKAFPDNPATVLKDDTIGPKIGKEMRNNAIIAVILAMGAMLLYIGFRFEFIYGLGAIIALLHDVLFTIAIVVCVHHLGWINLEFSSTILAAMLTVVGFSVNDTVIVFDRIRENLERHKGMNFMKLVNMSVNETLSRTINTVLTVVLVLLAMVVLSGPVLEGFAFTMLIGIIVGTYSSIYIASSFVIWYLEKVKKVDFSDEGKKPSAAKA